MTFAELHKKAESLYSPALLLRDQLPYERRKSIERALTMVTGLLLVLFLLAAALAKLPVGELPLLSTLAGLMYKLEGLFSLSFAAWFIFVAIESFHRSYYFHGLEQILSESRGEKEVLVGWGVSTIVHDTDPRDVTGAFLLSEFGQEILYRLGVTEDVFSSYYAKRMPQLTIDTFTVPDDISTVTLSVYAGSVYDQDQSFQQFLAGNRITREHLVDAADWVTSIERAQRRRARFWSRDSLGRIPGIGKTWGYGETYLLERYGYDLIKDRIWPVVALKRYQEDDEVEDIEQVLVRARESNVLVVGDDAAMIRERVAQLYRKIREGAVLPPLESSRIFLIDLERILTTHNDKASFEITLQSVLNQAVHAGNSIVYFEHLATAVKSVATAGVDLVEILQPYLTANVLQVVATSDVEGFTKTLSRDQRVAQAFDVVKMRTIDSAGMLHLLEQRAELLEGRTGVVCTIPALHTVARLADGYFPTGVMPDKAFDLMEELVTVGVKMHTLQLRAEHVEALVEQKSGVPVGQPDEEERTKLLALEDILHARVIGQDRAVSAVSMALRRARSGVTTAERPLGSFLFLGPTGVGKTETAKALADAVFGDEEAMLRLDMSEFQSERALADLIGSTETNEPGRLATMLREQQYGVILLDEFEKSDRSVHDLFLQILDEGVFTDAFGKSVNARHALIIATSNAGADHIWEWSKQGGDLHEKQQELIDTLIKEGIFRPEFLNRFDDVILYEPLSPEHVVEIARLQLGGFASRLAESQNITLVITDALVEAVARAGYDPKFGGRAMRRVIKEQVEQAVADKMLKGELTAGGTVELAAGDIA